MLPVILTLLFLAALAESGCPSGWYQLRNSCYFVSHSHDSTWTQGEVYCTAHGGHLAHIDDDTENVFLRGLAVASRGQCVWFGATDMHSEGTWKSSLTYRPLTYFGQWEAGQPDNWKGNENCLCLNQRSGYLWNDAECNFRTNFICEKQSACPSGWYQLQNSCYFVSHSHDSTWTQGEVYCTAHGGHLAHIDDDTENVFLRGLAVASRGQCVWFGATDMHSEGTWKSSLTYRPLTYFGQWEAGQPDNWKGNENCLCLDKGGGYLWNDAECNFRTNFICEKPL